MTNQTQVYLNKLILILKTIDQKKVNLLKNKIARLIDSNKTLFICGNGGSAATSSHMACDLGKTILGKHPRKNDSRLRVISLNDNIPLMTAWGNDEGYEYIFSEQLRNLAKKGDLLLVITGSGNSANIVKVVEEAKNRGVETFGLLGFDGGKVRKMLDDYLLIKSNNYGLIEDIHAIINHLITDYLKEKNE